ncbi:hypothetical protein [Halorhabdus rudnickae]|uniref:hypothetical protein n=1 Tax=Halorhabdus rudnickae TaxID=1775544 RepID=UPI0010843339|nr:hypothetical protein [Halorhabdus rudnickae]
MSDELSSSFRRGFLKLMAGSAVSASFIGEAFGKQDDDQKHVKVTENKNWKIISIKKTESGIQSSADSKNQQNRKDFTEQAVKLAEESDDIRVEKLKNKYKIKCEKRVIKKKKEKLKDMREKHRDKIKKQDREVRSQINNHVDEVRSQVIDSAESDTEGDA